MKEKENKGKEDEIGRMYRFIIGLIVFCLLSYGRVLVQKDIYLLILSI